MTARYWIHGVRVHIISDPSEETGEVAPLNLDDYEPEIHKGIQLLRKIKDMHPDAEIRHYTWPDPFIRVSSEFGRDEIRLHAKPPEPEKVEEKKDERVTMSWPVLGVLLTDENEAAEVCVGDLHPYTTDPAAEGGWFYMDKDAATLEQGVPLEMDTGYSGRHERLDYIGQDDYQWDENSGVESYTPAADDVILEHEFAYRSIWDPFGRNWVPVEPLIFTCGDYEDQTTSPLEHYTEKDRAVDWYTYDTYSVIVENEVIATGQFVTHHPYTLEYVEDITIPDDLPGDGWTNEQIDNCCYEPGTYEVWRRTTGTATYNGVQVYHELGEGSDEVKSYELSQHGACLYSRYNYAGSAYDYQLIFYMDGVEHVVSEGSRAATGYTDIPDDIYVSDFKMFDFKGSPVVVFAYFHYYWTQDNYIRYGIGYQGNLWLTETFLNDKWPTPNWNRHDIQEMRADRGLEGYGEVTAFGITAAFPAY